MSPSLTNKTIAITASRRAEEQAVAFERQGARVVLAPTVRIIKTDDDALLITETRQVLENRPQMLLVTTGYGLKSWVEAVEKTDLATALREALEKTEIYVRGAKGRGAVRGMGLQESGMAEVETTESLVELALFHGAAGKNVTIQQHGKPDLALVKKLESAAAHVTQVHPNRWAEPEEPYRAEALIDSLIEGKIDAITFTAAPAVEALLDRASKRNRQKELVVALAKIKVATVGPVTAEPLEKLGITPIIPERSRMGAMIKELTAALES